MAKTLSKLLKSQVGKGGKKYWKYAGFVGHIEWCGAFVWWCLHHCSEKYEYMKASQNPFYVPNVEAWAKKHGRERKSQRARQGVRRTRLLHDPQLLDQNQHCKLRAQH